MTLKMTIGAALLAGILLPGCATSAANGSASYRAEVERLEAECTARDGILTPTGSQTTYPRRDYACKITGGASRLN